ncbi:helix-turn-helix transcriptional regulator [Arcticibacter eurypsychrophilus]|uniref:helix-turn-helix transcriptional regulator n=1 Tax=Arcticibacter eurypsychrophilus TaxID=1434752 RepID=UPI00084DC32E|nr:transcriptional regulator [Arcticibacter eurypsychrophilus]
MDQGKMERLLRLLMLLIGKRLYTRIELAERSGISERTIYRYLDTIESAGFILERKEDSYCLKTDTPAVKTLQQLLHFSNEEAFLLFKTMAQLQGASPLKDCLARKLNTLYDFRALTKLKDVNIHEQVHILFEAITSKKKVCLHNYRSSNSENISDRQVEPFGFLADYTAVWCFDLESNTCKQFRISRIQEVHILENIWQFAEMHKIPFTDVFRMSDSQPLVNVEVLLTLKAYNLLKEEFPLAEQFIKQEDKGYRLFVPIANFHGIGRFVLGLSGQVQVIGPEIFKKFLSEEIKKQVLTLVGSEYRYV